jgi:ubiquinone/menaquinone biosynthesis C-methylase UbiE
MVRAQPATNGNVMHVENEKEAVRDYWNASPCGTRDVGQTEADHELERIRYEREPFIERFARFEDARARRLLEVGVGAGTDHLRFARAGAICTGIDLSEVSLQQTRTRVAAEGLTSDLQVADAENLPFPSGTFDVAYSWGVIHHTPDTRRAAQEILRVLRPGGRFCVMVYNRHSLLAAQAWLLYAALRGTPQRSLADVLAHHVESPGTKGYTSREARALFAGASAVHVETVVTAYDMRIGRRRFLPQWSWRAVPKRFGWFHVATGMK